MGGRADAYTSTKRKRSVNSDQQKARKDRARHLRSKS